MWTDDEAALLIAILDEIIPPSHDGRVPGAGQLGVAEFLPSATAYARDPVGAIRQVLAHVQEQGELVDASRDRRVAMLQRTEADRPDAFATLIQLTYMGYYARPDTRPLFGVGAHPVHPGGYDVAPDGAAEIAELTAPVRNRGKAYRDDQ